MPTTPNGGTATQAEVIGPWRFLIDETGKYRLAASSNDRRWKHRELHLHLTREGSKQLLAVLTAPDPEHIKQQMARGVSCIEDAPSVIVSLQSGGTYVLSPSEPFRYSFSCNPTR
jgi:hypothetical protein